MKKIFSILLLLILLFNWFGYRLLLSFMQDEANLRLEEQLDKNRYDPSQLVSIKVPVIYLPYYHNNNSDSFERVDGQIEIQGIPYKYVKQRIFNDTLELLCIPNHAAIKLQTAENIFFKFTNDCKQGKKSEPHSGVAKVFSPDYCADDGSFKIGDPAYEPGQAGDGYDGRILSHPLLAAEHPPQLFFLL